MTGKKLNLAYIANDSVRKTAFQKRKKSLMKKVRELSTLCGIDACAIVCSPYDRKPEVWPSNLGVQRVMSQFKRMPEMEQRKYMTDQETFLKQRIIKSEEKLNKQARDNRETEITQIMFQSLVGNCPSLDLIDLNDLGWVIDRYLKDIDKKFETFNNLVVGGSSSSAGGTAGGEAAAAVAPPEAPDHGAMQNIGESSQTAASGRGGEMNMDSLENQLRSMELVNSPDLQQLGTGGDDMILRFGNIN